MKGLILKVLLLLFFTQSFVYGGSLVNDFRRDIPAMWRCWSLRYTGTQETTQESPFTLEGEAPIILVHGYLNTNTGWIDFRKALEKEKLGPIYAPTLHSSSQDIRRSAIEIAQLVEEVREQNDGKPVILIGHSMGGIICAYCTQHIAPRGSVKAVFTLASPLRGTKTATLGFGRAGSQMRCDSRFLKSLNAQLTYQPKAAYFCLGSRSDQVVRPCRNSFYKEPDDEIHFHLYTDIGHQSFLFSEDVMRDVISMIHTLDDAGSGNHP